MMKHKERSMNTLIYKRTHRGDPNDSGVFGVHDCMGPVRRWNFNAVIGIGGNRPWSGHEQMANKVNWVGINPTKTNGGKRRGPLVSFERFVLYDKKNGNGPKLKKLAPNLYQYMYEDQHVRLVMSRSLNKKIQDEITKILKLAKKHKRARPFAAEPMLNKNRCCGRKVHRDSC